MCFRPFLEQIKQRAIFLTSSNLLLFYRPCSLDVKRETSTIEFNSHLLTINEVSLTSDALHGDRPLKPESIATGEKPERASVTFANALPAKSTAQLGIRFSGQLQGTLVGVSILCTSHSVYSLKTMQLSLTSTTTANIRWTVSRSIMR